MENRRRFPRFESTFQVKYCPEGIGDGCGYTIADDISEGGIKMPASSGIVNKGDVVKLYMKNDAWKKYVLAIGKVKWATALHRDAPLDEEIGIEFINSPTPEISKFIKSI